MIITRDNFADHRVNPLYLYSLRENREWVLVTDGTHFTWWNGGRRAQRTLSGPVLAPDRFQLACWRGRFDSPETAYLWMALMQLVDE